jgi:hypothetical protein
MPKPTAKSVALLLGGLHEDLRQLFVERSQTTQARRRGALQRQLLLGLELLWKIEEQVLLPALHGALPGALPMLRRVSDELELMRDLALLTTQTHTDNREMTLTVLEGMATLHFARVAELVHAAPAEGVDWPATSCARRARSRTKTATRWACRRAEARTFLRPRGAMNAATLSSARG